jgi:predicted transcriptional regulator
VDSSQLSKRERQIMDVVFAHGEATVSQMLAEMPDPPMRGALRTLVRILERKGHLSHRQIGREFIYRPTQPRGQAGRTALERVLDVFFGGSLENAVAAHLSDRSAAKITKEELQRLSNLIEKAKIKGG